MGLFCCLNHSTHTDSHNTQTRIYNVRVPTIVSSDLCLNIFQFCRFFISYLHLDFALAIFHGNSRIMWTFLIDAYTRNSGAKDINMSKVRAKISKIDLLITKCYDL